MDAHTLLGLAALTIFALAVFVPALLESLRYSRPVDELTDEDIKWFNSQPLSGEAWFGDRIDSDSDDREDDNPPA